MSKFHYTLPSGAEYIVNGPEGATQADADLVFYQQVAAGALLGYSSGQTLSSVSYSPITFDLTREQRGTAGIDNYPILAVNGKADILNGIVNSLIGNATTGNANPTSNLDVDTVVSIIQNLPQVSGIPNLGNVIASNVVTQVDVMQAKGQGLGPVSVGPLSPFQVQSLQAQTSNIVDQPYDVITQEKGIGKYGFNCYQLECVGYVKPGTSAMFIENDPSNFVTTMNSPAIWTGQDGIFSLQQLLNDENFQNTVQNQLMQHGYDGLTASGVISNTSQPAVSVNSGWMYTDSGLQPASPLSQLGGNFGLLGGLLASSTTTYDTVESGVTSASSPTLNVDQYNYNTLTSTLTNSVNADVGALVNNSAKFGPELTSIWANTGSGNELSNLLTQGLNTVNENYSLLNNVGGVGASLGGITATNPLIATNSLAGISNTYTTGGSFDLGTIGGIAGQLTNLPNIATELTSQLDSFGKAAQSAMSLASEATNLGGLASLSSLGDLASGALSSLGDLSLSSLSGLAGSAADALSNIPSNLASLSNLGDLASSGLAQLGNLGSLGSLSGLTGNFGGITNLLSSANLGSLNSLFGGTNALTSGIQFAGGFSNTFNRSTLDNAVNQIIGNPKITLPDFEYPSAESIASALDVSQAQNFLNDAKNSASGLLTSVGSSLGFGSAPSPSLASNGTVPIFTQDQINKPLS